MTPEARVMLLARTIAARYGHPEDADVLEAAPSRAGIAIRYRIPECREANADVHVDERFAEDMRNGAIGLELSARFSEIARLAGRARALAACGDDAPHAWSVAVPRLFAEVIGRYGIEMTDMHRDIDRYGGAEGAPLQGRPDVEIRGLRIDMGRLLGTIAIGGDLDVVAEDDEDGCCSVLVRDVGLPESSMPALTGMPLEAVLSHRDLDGLQGYVVASARQGTSSGRRHLRISLRPDFTWCGPAPDDADVSWRGIREGARMRKAPPAEESRF